MVRTAEGVEAEGFSEILPKDQFALSWIIRGMRPEDLAPSIKMKSAGRHEAHSGNRGNGGMSLDAGPDLPTTSDAP